MTNQTDKILSDQASSKQASSEQPQRWVNTHWPL